MLLFISLFLCCHHTHPHACSGSVSKLSLQPCDLISLTDCGCLGKASLSLQSPFSSTLRSLWQTHSGTFRNAVLSPGRPSMVSSHNHTHARAYMCTHTNTKYMPYTMQAILHTGVRANTQTQKYAKNVAGRTLSPRHTYCVWHTSSITTLLVPSQVHPQAVHMHKEVAVLLFGLWLLSEIPN